MMENNLIKLVDSTVDSDYLSVVDSEFRKLNIGNTQPFIKRILIKTTPELYIDDFSSIITDLKNIINDFGEIEFFGSNLPQSQRSGLEEKDGEAINYLHQHFVNSIGGGFTKILRDGTFCNITNFVIYDINRNKPHDKIIDIFYLAKNLAIAFYYLKKLLASSFYSSIESLSISLNIQNTDETYLVITAPFFLDFVIHPKVTKSNIGIAFSQEKSEFLDTSIIENISKISDQVLEQSTLEEIEQNKLKFAIKDFLNAEEHIKPVINV